MCPLKQKFKTTLTHATQQLATLTWACALRRANIFSQALSIALSSYLCSITDFTNGSTKFDHWKSHGFLINFEGMLSAAGQEKHMIEDACVGIEMLRNVRIRCDRGLENNNIRDLTNVPKVSERSERAFWKTSILAMKCAKWLQTASSTTRLTLFHPIRLARSVCFARASLKMRLVSLGAEQKYYRSASVQV